MFIGYVYPLQDALSTGTNNYILYFCQQKLRLTTAQLLANLVLSVMCAIIAF